MTDHETPDPAATAAFGVGPWWAMLNSLSSANQANGLLYQNAVANQQIGNIIGMVATMNTVQTLLGNPAMGVPPPLDMFNTAAAADNDERIAQLHRHHELQHRHQLQLIQRAGIALCVAAIAQEPDKADIYCQAIEKIRQALE